MYTVAVLDDDSEQAEALAAMVERSTCAKRLGGVFALSPDGLAPWLEAGNRADILLSDIKLDEGGPDGIDLVERHFPRESGTQVVYVTGYAAEYCTAVYRTDHVYLVEKPVEQCMLDRALEKACRRLDEDERPIAVQFGRTTHVVLPSRIVYVENVGRKIRIVLNDRTVETYLKIDELKSRLPATFCQCHKSFLVNLARVVEVDGLSLVMADGSRVPVAKARRPYVKTALARYVRGVL